MWGIGEGAKIDAAARPSVIIIVCIPSIRPTHRAAGVEGRLVGRVLGAADCGDLGHHAHVPQLDDAVSGVGWYLWDCGCDFSCTLY
jgi:hypothetical protein